MQITMLNSMASRDFVEALDRHVGAGFSLLDLKDAVFGKQVTDLSAAEAERAAGLCRERGLSVYCMSTGLFYDAVERGEGAFRAEHLGRIDRTIEIARALQPTLVRLLAARTERRVDLTDAVGYVNAEHAWLPALYAEAIDRLAGAGFGVTIENEVHGCILGSPEEVIALFEAIDRPGRVSFTWDVQNMWQMGTFPSLDVYDQLRPLIGYLHVKGGRCEGGDPDRRLKWRSGLEDASWPVEEIVDAAVHDGVCDVICVNPSHGSEPPEGDPPDVCWRDVAFLQRVLSGAD